jgi:hypothetical protein
MLLLGIYVYTLYAYLDMSLLFYIFWHLLLYYISGVTQAG